MKNIEAKKFFGHILVESSWIFHIERAKPKKYPVAFIQTLSIHSLSCFKNGEHGSKKKFLNTFLAAFFVDFKISAKKIEFLHRFSEIFLKSCNPVSAQRFKNFVESR